MMDWLIDEFKQEQRHRRPQGQDGRCSGCKDAAEQAKKELSSAQEADHQPALPHRRRLRPQASAEDARGAKFEQMIRPSSSNAHHEAGEEGLN